MFNSKVFTVIIVLTLVCIGGAVTLQVLEMQEYNLFETIKKSFSSEESSSTPAPVEEKTEEKPAENAEAAKEPDQENAPAQ